MLTQLLSVSMTYVLFSRNSSDNRLGMRYKLWFGLACAFPVVALIVIRWNAGMSALATFIGTAVTGILQVFLAVNMGTRSKRAKSQP